MILKELTQIEEGKKHDKRVDFVEGWADMYLDDHDTIEDAEEDLWSMVEDDEERAKEAKKIGLTKEIAFEILANIADRMGLFDHDEDEDE